ncbi:MAG TPA: FAD-dependent oxidoreductase [Candidatus Limnocylindrales bacterium]|nr:FAD-dependent oxidoreductase [Candidatus Limnocylindrales bacterium]
MSYDVHRRSLTERLIDLGAQAAALTWPVMGRVFPEKLEVDDNHSYWASQTPDYRPGPPLKGQTTADLAIIGGGFTGVSTAYYFSRRYPEKRVVLLEAKSLANGASGRNGGMMLNWVTGVTDHSDETTRRIYDSTKAGMDSILALIERHHLPVQHRLEGTVTVYTSAQRAEKGHAECERYNRIGIPVRYLSASELHRDLNLQGTYGGELDPNSGQINGAQLVRSLRPVLIEQDVAIYEQTPVLKIREGAGYTLTTPEGEVEAKAIVFATNGYSGKFPQFRDALFPLHSHVFATGPLSPEQRAELGWRAYAGYSDDLDRIAYSTMTDDGSIIFGGGSNASYTYLFNNRTAYPGTPGSAKRSFDAIEGTFRQYLPGGAALPITHRWTGTLGITLSRTPLIGARGANHSLLCAIGYCGHGVTLANLAGEILTDLYSGDDEHWRDLPFVNAHYPKLPPEPFRWIGYQTFTRLTGKSPRV